jgi:hypothetical protein
LKKPEWLRAVFHGGKLLFFEQTDNAQVPTHNASIILVVGGNGGKPSKCGVRSGEGRKEKGEGRSGDKVCDKSSELTFLRQALD